MAASRGTANPCLQMSGDNFAGGGQGHGPHTGARFLVPHPCRRCVSMQLVAAHIQTFIVLVLVLLLWTAMWVGACCGRLGPWMMLCVHVCRASATHACGFLPHAHSRLHNQFGILTSSGGPTWEEWRKGAMDPWRGLCSASGSAARAGLGIG